MSNSPTLDWRGASAYRDWLLSAYPYWSRVLKPGEKKTRQVASCEFMQLPKELEGFFSVFNGQKTHKQVPIPFMPSFGYTLLDIPGVACRRNNELGLSHLIRALPGGFEYSCESGVREGLWRKAWYPIAEVHIDFGPYLLFADFDPPSSGRAGQVILQSQWLGWSSGWCQRVVLADGLDPFFARLAELGHGGRLVYRESFGIDVANRDDQEVCHLLGIDRVRLMPTEAECRP